MIARKTLHHTPFTPKEVLDAGSAVTQGVWEGGGAGAPLSTAEVVGYYQSHYELWSTLLHNESNKHKVRAAEASIYALIQQEVLDSFFTITLTSYFSFFS